MGLISAFILVVLSVLLSGSEYYTSLIGVSLVHNTNNTKNEQHLQITQIG